MSTIPVSLTQEQFEQHIRPQLSVAKRGYVCKIPLVKVFNYILYRLHTSCQWERLPIDHVEGHPQQQEITYHGVYHHFRKWSKDGSLERVFKYSILSIRDQIDPHHVNLDGSHVLAKKGGEAVAYQGRKRAKTSNILPLTDANGVILASTGIIAGNHHDAFALKHTLSSAFKFIKRLGISLTGSYFNADSGFDTKAARQTCFNHNLIPNIAENPRARKRPKRGRKRLFNKAIYKLRFSSERTFAWIDKFRALLVRFDRKAAHFLGAHYIAYSLINMRHLLAHDKSQ